MALKRLLATGMLAEHEGKSSQVDVAAELERCRASFRHFLTYWRFINRETGDVLGFAELWEGQAGLAALMEQESWIFALKAGKLGFTELECAFDAWALRFSRANARVHVFSRDARAAEELVRYVRFGLEQLPSWMRLPVSEQPGSDTSQSLRLQAGQNDLRTLAAYPAGARVAIDLTSTHSHVDELAHMPFAELTWSAIQSTIAPTGTCHIITRGADSEFLYRLWQAAEGGDSPLVQFFAPWTARPGRDRAWRDAQATLMRTSELLYFAPETPDDAFAADEITSYLPAPLWDDCYDAALIEPPPGAHVPIVLGVDAAVSKDCFAIVGVSRHPERPGDPAIRFTKVWDPRETGGRIDFNDVEHWLRVICGGACPRDHSRSKPDPRCELCAHHIGAPLRYRVRAIVYDPHQMEAMAQRLTHERVAYFREFSQGSARESADNFLHLLVHQGRLSHNGDSLLREHVLNAGAKITRDEELKIRIVKRSPSRRIDAAVAASMAVYEAMALNL